METAKEFYERKRKEWINNTSDERDFEQLRNDVMIEFARQHLQACKEASAEEVMNVLVKDEDGNIRTTIENSYPLDNIK